MAAPQAHSGLDAALGAAFHRAETEAHDSHAWKLHGTYGYKKKASKPEMTKPTEYIKN